jgi:hypothetical protein
MGPHLPFELLVHEPIADPNLHRQQRKRRPIERLQRQRRLAGLISGRGLGRPSV